MKWILAALVVILSVPMSASAQEPATRPSQKQGLDGRFQRRFPSGGMMRRVTPQDIDETRAFIREHFPNQNALIEQFPENSPARFRMMQHMVYQYRPLMRLEEQNPDLFESLLAQRKAEDQALGIAAELKANKEGAEEQLREVVGGLVDRSLRERQERIMRLRRALEVQERKLDEDKQNRDRLIAQQVERLKNMYERIVRMRDRSLPATDRTDAHASPERD